MGNPTSKKPGMRSKKKEYKRSSLTKRRAKDLDQIQSSVLLVTKKGLLPEGTLNKVEYNDELPGCGQFFVWESDKHFISQKAMDDHKATREFKRRVKQLKEEAYSKDYSEWAAGMTKEVLPPAHPELAKKAVN